MTTSNSQTRAWHSLNAVRAFVDRYMLAVIFISITVVLATVFYFAWLKYTNQANSIVIQRVVDDESTAKITTPHLLEKPFILNAQQNTKASSSAQKSPSSFAPSSTNATVMTGSSNSVQINGTRITVPTNGEVHKRIQSKNGTTTVDISINSNSSTSNSSSLDLNVQSSTESTRHVEK